MDDPSSSSHNGKASTKDKSKGKEHSPSTSSSNNAAPQNWGAPPPNNMPYPNYPPPPDGYGGHHPYPPGAAGYPPPPPYPGYPPPYPNEYAHQHHNNYHGHGHGHGHPPYDYPPNHDPGRGFIRGFILCSCIMFTAFFIVTILVALAMHPSLPKYQITSMTVENFGTTNTLTGNWYTTILVENPNDKLTGYFGDFKVFVLHKERELTGGYAPGMVLPKNEKKQFSVNSPASNFGNYPDLDAMAKERASGSVTFEVTITSITELKSSSVSTNPESLTAVCEGLKVVFQNSTTGTLENGPVDCEIHI